MAAMGGVFLRSLVLDTPAEMHCIAGASRTTSDGTFAVASDSGGAIRVYAASCGALLHEFATIHRRVFALHYTSFSDALVTLEGDAARSESGKQVDETFLCVYHDWREKKMVRGYTLPLGVLDAVTSQDIANHVAVCCFTGRVAVAMGSVINIWQCSAGFFEHVLELRVDLSQHGAYHEISRIAIHGIYVAYASSTEVRVMEIHVRSTSDGDVTSEPVLLAASNPRHRAQGTTASRKKTAFPDDDPSCVHFRVHGDLSSFESISIPLASIGDVNREGDNWSLQERSNYSVQDGVPEVLDRNEAEQEAANLAGLVKSQDVRVNLAMNYQVAEQDMRVLMQRFLPPNQTVQSLKFLPETIDNRLSLEPRTYTRLLVGTSSQGFLYYFLSDEADATRKKMSKKVLGKEETGRARGAMSSVCVGKSRAPNSGPIGVPDGDTVESGRVVMHYRFSSPVSCVSANSSFLFAVTSSVLEVWSIWSPCHHIAATRALSQFVTIEPAVPQLLCMEPIPHPMQDIVALDAHVILIPSRVEAEYALSKDRFQLPSSIAEDFLPSDELELRGAMSYSSARRSRKAMIFQQSPPLSIFTAAQAMTDIGTDSRISLLLSLFSLYRYRADVGAGVLAQIEEEHRTGLYTDKRELIAFKLETDLYDSLAEQAAAELATIFWSDPSGDVSQAALFFVASGTSPSSVLTTLRQADQTSQSRMVEATQKYLEACLFPPKQSSLIKSSVSSVAAHSPGFTRMVLEHYTQHAPDQIARLVTDSAIEWSPDDLHFALSAMNDSSNMDSSAVELARIVLILRASSFSEDDWEVCRVHSASQYAVLRSNCSHDALRRSVAGVISQDPASLVNLCVARPRLLVDSRPEARSTSVFAAGSTATALANALVSQASSSFVRIIEAIFKCAIASRESVMSTILFCFQAVGSTALSTIQRISDPSSASFSCQQDAEFGTAQCVLLRVVLFFLDQFPVLCAQAERDEINEDQESLLSLRRTLASEYLQLCVQLAASIGGPGGPIEESLRRNLTALLGADIASISIQNCGITEWEVQYMKTRCIPADEDVAAIIASLFGRAILLVHERDLHLPEAVLRMCDAVLLPIHPIKRFPPREVDDFSFLLVILALPKLSRTIDGLKLIANRPDCMELFLPYGKSNCTSLDEWRFLIEALSSLNDTSPEGQATNEVGVLERVLHHICLTLGPDDLLQVLPEDGDLALFMATIEASVRLENTRTSRMQPVCGEIDTS